MSGDRGHGRLPPVEPAAPGAKVTRLELFYDLVFVYAFLNVTTVTAKHLTPVALLKSLLVLALLWFAWTTFAALGNVVRADQGVMSLAGFAIMAAVVALAVTLPEAFEDAPRGLPGDLVFATCYLLVRGLQVLAFWYGSTRLRRPSRPLSLLALPVFGSTLLLLLAATAPQRLFSGNAEFAARVAFWVVAIALEYSVSAFFPIQEATIVSAGHWAERYAQIVLIAFGESILSLGIGPNLTAGLPLTWAILLSLGLGVALIAALWWAYFDVLVIAGEETLHRTRGPARVALARDAYVYLHLPMIVGIIFFSLGLKRVLADIANPAVPSLRDTLVGSERFALYGGVILYLLALIGFQWRIGYRVSPYAVSLALLVAIQVPFGNRLPEALALVVLAATTVGLVVASAVRSREPRRVLRRRRLREQRELEAEETEWRRRHL